MLTAVVAALLFAVPSIARGTDMNFSCCWNCMAGILVWFLGVLPAFMLAGRGPYFTGGHAFAAGFLGVGGGSALGVLLQVLYPGVDPAKRAEAFKEIAKEAMREFERQGQPAPVPEAELESCLATVFVGAPIPLALVGSVVAGFVAVLTLRLINRRQQRPQSQPPQSQPPQPLTPINPYSNPEA